MSKAPSTEKILKILEKVELRDKVKVGQIWYSKKYQYIVEVVDKPFWSKPLNGYICILEFKQSRTYFKFPLRITNLKENFELIGKV